MELPGDVKLPMPPKKGDLTEVRIEACFKSHSELCPKVENVEFTNLEESMRDVIYFFKELIIGLQKQS